MKLYEIDFSIVDVDLFNACAEEVATNKRQFYVVKSEEFEIGHCNIKVQANNINEVEKRFYSGEFYIDSRKYIAWLGHIQRIDGRKDENGKTLECDIEFTLCATPMAVVGERAYRRMKYDAQTIKQEDANAVLERA